MYPRNSRNSSLATLVFCLLGLSITSVAEETSDPSLISSEAAWVLYDQLINMESLPVQCESAMVHRPDSDTAFIPVEMKGRVWKKGRRTRTDEQWTIAAGQAIGKMKIGIVYPDASYASYEYDPVNDTYIKLADGPSPVDFLKQGREKQVIKILGTEVLNGLQTTIIQIKSKANSTESNQKLWIGISTGLVMRSEMRMAPYTQFRELKNCVFEEFPDSALEVPQDKVVPSTSTLQ